jgi:PST family polysaccharide transporter
MVLFGICGLGPMSFVLPTLLVALYETVCFGSAAGGLPCRNKLTWSLARELISASMWIMTGTLAVTLINQADYLVIGKLKAEVLGVYFFGCQLATGFAAIVGTGIRAVLMPTLARLADEPERFGAAYVRSIRTMTFVSMPSFIVAAVLAPPIIDLCWNGKWNLAQPVAVLMTLGLAFRVLTPVALAALEARGAWKPRAVVLWIDAGGTMIGAVAGCLIGDLLAIAVCVATSRAVMAVVQCFAAGSVSHTSVGRVLGAIASSTMLASACALLSWWVTATWLSHVNQWVWSASIAITFALLFLTGSRLLMAKRLEEARHFVISLTPASKQTAAVNTVSR